ncbi:HbrB-like protein, partial [Thozetella sp. PMI_491]
MQPARPPHRAPGSFSPLPQSNASNVDLSRPRPRRLESSSSDDTTSAPPLTVSKARPSPISGPQGGASSANPPPPIYASFASQNNQNFSRPTLSTAVSAARSVAGVHSPSDNLPRNASPLTLPPTSPASSTYSGRGHSRKHSQNAGMFDSTLPSTSTSNLSQIGMAAASPQLSPTSHREMSASQIAAQAAQQQQQQQQQQAQQQAQQQQQQHHSRQRSQTVPAPGGEYETPVEARPKRGSGGPLSPPLLSLTEASVPRDSGFGNQGYHNGLLGSHTAAATTAANVVFPKSGQASPAMPSQAQIPQLPPPAPTFAERPVKAEKSKVKLFSRPGKIGTKGDPKEKPLPSPNKIGQALSSLQRGNFSTTSLDSTAQSFYSLANSSSATIRPVENEKEVKEKEKKHHFLSRQKQKLKDEFHLPLSSAMSNSKPTDPSAPSSLYSFNLPPPSPGPASSFKSGLDLRHGGRGYRDKKKDERVFDDAASTYTGDWPGPSSLTSTSAWGSSLHVSEPFDSSKFGLNNMTVDDAWPFLKAKLLVVFEGEDVRIPVEDLNRVVTMHLQFGVARRSPNLIVDDFRELLVTGFSSLDQTLRKTPEDRLIPALVELWIFAYTNVLPYLQAVFLPLDAEFTGVGSLMSAEQARDFWGGIATASPASQYGVSVSPASAVLEVRRMILLAFRDIVILPRYDTLKTMFSRLSLEFLPQSLASMALASPPLPVPSPGFHNSQNQFGQPIPFSSSPSAESQGSFNLGNAARPGTAMSLDPSVASYNSTGTTLLGEAGSGNRSRAISNVSFGSEGAISRPFTPSSLHALGAS